MSFFKITTTWSNAEFILIKLCMASAYILIGSYFHDFFDNYYAVLIVIFIITAIWFVYQWLKKMKSHSDLPY
ncbi:hypothetical protein [Flavobacterium quisquiliarum]|uniref:Uncharacterized protein n=1 Tax=Flavobacterium quisquiliarum TaxID=1834436 RepID=A0ABV8WCG9_9FLAO|nr:hypothetical protein [Flavobacterium quisquiliarum]MBW1658739.1 hypothetical protein [Flavobacterium quisquiliarum]NWL03470.1 hypothetical protein [Flavobacterium collinsii]